MSLFAFNTDVLRECQELANDASQYPTIVSIATAWDQDRYLSDRKDYDTKRREGGREGRISEGGGDTDVRQTAQTREKGAPDRANGEEERREEGAKKCRADEGIKKSVSGLEGRRRRKEQKGATN